VNKAEFLASLLFSVT